ncbi:MAG: ABC transporter substrate-binding protein [Hespellia sp.]|nr:ABC transporter substrate-binding protein [Hespellia sp.]
MRELERENTGKKIVMVSIPILLAVLLFCFIRFDKAIPDGTYSPTSFQFTGGTGKVEIGCQDVIITNGKAAAEITFSSDAYDYVKVDGKQYNTTVSDGSAQVTIPVRINGDTTILADTTKMSESHEIEYVLSITLDTTKADAAVQAAKPDEKKADTQETDVASDQSEEQTPSQQSDQEETLSPPEIGGLTYESTMDIDYAKCFQVYYYQDGYALIHIAKAGQYLVVPEGKKAPEGLDASITVLQKPLNHIYLVATSAMSLFDSMDALDSIRLSGTDADGWYVENAGDAMKAGKILFAGKYSEPDYELLLEENTDLSIQSTMILHSPEVQEKLEELGIPVLIDRSSYEPEPLGRTEWIKLYSVLVDKEETAQAKFAEQAQMVSDLADFQNTGKTVAFFYINTTGNVVVRKSDDYVPKMIELAGGKYMFSGLKNEGTSSSVNMTMEEFYDTAKNADYLIYNATIDAPLSTMDELLAKSELFADFKAVKSGNVWSTGKSMYQETDIIGEMIADIHVMLTTEGKTQLKFMKKLQ